MSASPEPQSTNLPDWANDYLAQLGSHIQGNLTPSQLLERMRGLTAEDLEFRATEIDRLLHGSGIHDVGEQDHWHLDPLPLVLGEQTWAALQEGIRQRTQLMLQVLRDIYGPRRLVTDGIIPASQLYQDPLFLREAFTLGGENSGPAITAVDLYRDLNGTFKVLADHTQYPNGMGLLLENRLISRRVMSELFANVGVRRIAGFFRKMQRSINQLTRNLRDPRVVILTPGLNHFYYAEHAYLATYLGYTLVQSGDLTVRRGKVWLKTLGGLRKVDVIIRWVPDTALDSLEQTAYSPSGIPGLLQAVRNGAVKLFNPFGYGVLESPVVNARLDAISQHLTGQPLALAGNYCQPAVAGIPADLARYDLCFYLGNDQPLDGASAVDKINQAVADHPERCYFRAKPQISEEPFWHNGALTSRPVFLRCFILVDGEDIHLMPSALCFDYAAGAERRAQQQPIKDTWVQSSKPIVEDFSSSKRLARPDDLALVEGEIPSRTAENLYWLGCNLERMENSARLLRLFIDRQTEVALLSDEQIQPTLDYLYHAIAGGQTVFPFSQEGVAPARTTLEECKKLAFQLLASRDIPGSLTTSIGHMLRSAVSVRELLSYDSWLIVERFEEELERIQRTSARSSNTTFHKILDNLVGQVMAFNGSVLDSLSNSNGWFLLDIGRRVERARQLVAMISTLLVDQLEDSEQQIMLDTVLLAQVSQITHRRRFRMYQSVETGLELLLLDAAYPRSLVYQIGRIDKLSKLLPGKRNEGNLTPSEKALLRLYATSHLIEPQKFGELIDGKRSHLREMLAGIREDLDNFEEVMQVQYFTHTTTPHRVEWDSSRK